VRLKIGEREDQWDGVDEGGMGRPVGRCILRNGHAAPYLWPVLAFAHLASIPVCGAPTTTAGKCRQLPTGLRACDRLPGGGFNQSPRLPLARLKISRGTILGYIL
jgi:hypothetical protein